MRALRQDIFILFLVTGILAPVLSARCLAQALAAAMPTYTYKCLPLPPVKIAYRIPGSAYASAIQCMKRLPDGAQVFVHQKTIVGYNLNDLYIEEADRSAGIRIDISPSYPASPLVVGNTVSFAGVMATANAERIIIPQSPIDYDFNSTANILSLGMSAPAIAGWPTNTKQPYGPRIAGLMPIGLRVRVWGKVYGSGSIDPVLGSNFVYLDDGWHKRDGTPEGYPGIRVYSDKLPLSTDNILTATGVCTTITYDPTPGGASGDEFVIPVIRTTDVNDLDCPGAASVMSDYRPVQGHVRLIGQSEPGLPVRVYTERGSVVVENVTDQWMPFNLPAVSASGSKVCASATGFLSSTVDASGGQSGVDIELSPSKLYIEMTGDRDSIRICTSDSALISCLLRDAEGKGLPQKQIKLTTTMGSFIESRTREVIVTTDSDGFAQANLIAEPDGKGVASVRAESYPGNTASSSVNVQLEGPTIVVTASQSLLTQPGTSAITAHVTDQGVPLPNALVAFSTDCGAFRETGSNACGSVTDANGDARAVLSLNSQGTARVLAVHDDSCGHETIGWTVVAYCTQPWLAQGVQNSNPLVADLTGNGTSKNVVIVTSSGDLMALTAQGNVMWSVAMHPTGSNTPSCSTLDIDRSGLPCVFFPAETQQKVYAFAHDGKPLAGWPAGSDYRFAKCAAAVADANLDGSPEIIAGDECCYVFSWNPTGDWKGTGSADSSFLWRNLTGSPSTAIYGSSCAVGDFTGDSDGMPEVVVGTNRAPEVFAFPGDVWGDHILDPIYVPGWPKSSNGRAESSPALGDIDGDGCNDIAIGSDDGNIYIWLSSGNGSWLTYYVGGAVKTSPALADLDGDGKLDVIVGCDTGRVYAINWLGQAVAGWAGGIQLNQSGPYMIESSPVVGDVNGDGQVEVVIGCDDGNLYALYKDAAIHSVNGKMTGPIAWARSCVPPGMSGALMTSAAAIDDIDNDGKVEVVATSDKGVYVFHFDAPYSGASALYPWPTFHHDNQRTGCFTPLHAPVKASIQGIVTAGGVPIIKANLQIYNADGSEVLEPMGGAPRSPVLTVGGLNAVEVCRGAYSINQLDPNRTYKLKVTATGFGEKWIEVPVTTGLTRMDIAL